MKKITMILFILCGIILTSCETNESSNIDEPDPIDQQNIIFDPNETYTLDDTPNPLNLEIDTTDELMLVIDSILDKLQMFEDDYVVETYFKEEFPLVRSELDFKITKRSYEPKHNIDGLNVLYYLNRIKDRIPEQKNFKEDEWQAKNIHLYDFKWQIDDVFRIFVNDDKIYYSYYKEDGYDRIVALNVWVSNVDDILEYSIAMNAYYYDTGTWEHASQSYYKENEINYSWNVFTDEEGFNGITYLETNYQEDSYLQLTIDHSMESEGEYYKRVRYYNPETHLYYHKLYLNDEDDYTYIAKYNTSNHALFKISRNNLDMLNIEFNLMLMDGWDVIDRNLYQDTLFNDEQEIILPYGVRLEVSAYDGINLSRTTSTANAREAFTLENSGLTPPIDYEEYLILEDQIRAESMTMINDFYTDEYIANIEYHYALIFNQFDINVFYKIAQDYITE